MWLPVLKHHINAGGDISSDIEIEEVTTGHSQFQGDISRSETVSERREEDMSDDDSDIELISLPDRQGGGHSFEGGRNSERREGSTEEDERSLQETEVYQYMNC